MKTTTNSRSGFTLIEVIAVLVLLGILAAVAVPKYIDLTTAAQERALDAGIAELNGREALAWGKEMLENSGASVDDSTIFSEVDAADLGGDYTWEDPPTVTGGTLEFGDASVVLTRDAATTTSPGRWSGP